MRINSHKCDSCQAIQPSQEDGGMPVGWAEVTGYKTRVDKELLGHICGKCVNMLFAKPIPLRAGKPQ